MSKFTPGPWSYDQESMEISTPLRDGMSEIAVVETGWAEPFESEQQANAALIVAAPALYEALQGLMHLAGETPEGHAAWAALALVGGGE